MNETIKNFLEQAGTTNLKTKHYLKSYKGLKVKVSFGAGNVARIPWIALLREPNKVQDGIYPVLLYFKEVNKLVLAYGLSETKDSNYDWGLNVEYSIKDWYKKEFSKNPERYGDSKIKAIYDVKAINYDELNKDLNEIIDVYKSLNFSVINEPQFENDELAFRKQIKNSDSKSLTIFFQNLDRLISDLSIQDSDSAVFSTGSNQLSFQIGKRYCLNLKKDKFFFITKPEYEIENIEKGSFSDPKANYYKKATSKDVINHYDAISEAVSFEIERHSNTQEKEYDNSAFRKAVFDKDYRSKFIEMKNVQTKSISNVVSNFNIKNFISACHNSGLHYDDKLILRFLSSLITKPFVILTGLSGSGKTKLAQSFVQWICQDKSQYSIVPVGADWTNREPLLGYVNALENDKYVMPENGALEIIINANDNPNLPHFIILDEMNLSHVERYFADFLSVMESREKFKLHSSANTLEANNLDIEKQYKWPKNLFVVGTVNIDETTYMFSPKVLDRANVIEFRITEDEISKFLKESKEVLPLDGEGANMAVNFVELAKNKKKETSEKLQESLNNFFKELKKVGAEFGYRTAMEIQTLYAQIDKLDPEYANKVDKKIDFAIMQKLLPKLHGSRRKLVPVLTALGNLCYDGNDVIKDVFESEEELNYSDYKFPLAIEKLHRMYNGVIDNGFVSYAEA